MIIRMFMLMLFLNGCDHTHELSRVAAQLGCQRALIHVNRYDRDGQEYCRSVGVDL